MALPGSFGIINEKKAFNDFAAMCSDNWMRLCAKRESGDEPYRPGHSASCLYSERNMDGRWSCFLF